MLRSIFHGVSKTIEYPLYCAEVAIQGASTVVGGLWGAAQCALLGSAYGIGGPAAVVGGIAAAYVFNRLSAPKPFTWSEEPEEAATAATTSTAAAESTAPEPTPAIVPAVTSVPSIAAKEISPEAEKWDASMRGKLSDAGKTTRTPRPSWASRAMTAAGDAVRNTIGERPMAMPAPA